MIWDLKNLEYVKLLVFHTVPTAQISGECKIKIKILNTIYNHLLIKIIIMQNKTNGQRYQKQKMINKIILIQLILAVCTKINLKEYMLMHMQIYSLVVILVMMFIQAKMP
ncbi:MAG: hypothetical protein CMN09_01275 [Roseobacter sp.]|nr:hypothetical protein [Roseobacter sp.]